jgi:hypothetical protein
MIGIPTTWQINITRNPLQKKNSTPYIACMCSSQIIYLPMASGSC